MEHPPLPPNLSDEFEATIVRLPGKMAWPVCFIPSTIMAPFATKGRQNVKATIDGAEFAVTLLPSRNGHYLVYNQAMRAHCHKELGQALRLQVQPDDTPREVTVPADVEAALAVDPAASARFAALPYYRRREEINQIAAAKTAATRQKRIAQLLARLTVEN